MSRRGLDQERTAVHCDLFNVLPMLMHGAQPPSLVSDKTNTWRGALGSRCILPFPSTTTSTSSSTPAGYPSIHSHPISPTPTSVSPTIGDSHSQQIGFSARSLRWLQSSLRPILRKLAIQGGHQTRGKITGCPPIQPPMLCSPTGSHGPPGGATGSGQPPRAWYRGQERLPLLGNPKRQRQIKTSPRLHPG